MKKNNCFILTGAPGSGKTALLDELKKRGLVCVSEYARDVIAEQRSIDGEGVYDKNPLLFKELMLSRAIHQYLQADDERIVVFDRGIPDLLAYSDCFQLERGAEVVASNHYRYHDNVFSAPSWDAIYTNDEERRISFEEAKQFGDDLMLVYRSLGYNLTVLPLGSVESRVDFILDKAGWGKSDF